MAGIAALIPVAMQIWQGIQQNKQANKYADAQRPNMQVPQGMLNALDIQKNQALQTGLPGQYVIENKLDESAANAVQNIKSGATSPWEVISGSQKVAEMGMEKKKDLGIAGAEFQSQQADQLSRAFEGLSKLQQEQFMYNDYMPYANAMNASKSLREAGTQNLFSGVSNFAGVLANNPDMFKDIFGKKDSDNDLARFEMANMQKMGSIGSSGLFNKIPLDLPIK